MTNRTDVRADNGAPRAKRRNGRWHPRGRVVEATARDQVRALLGERKRAPDLLIEHLHLTQDQFGHLSLPHLAALAEEMRLPQAAVYEVATFYAHFDVVREGEVAPPEVTIRVCDSLVCEMKGAEKLIADLESASGPDVRVVRAPCIGRCAQAPAAEVGHRAIDHATPATVLAAAAARSFAPLVPDYQDLDAYRAGGGYALLHSCHSGDRSRHSLIETMEESGLRGLGGAGFPAGRKWRLVRNHTGPRLMAINADEGEPGTFKDRHCLETEPHRFLEGMLIAAWVVEAREIYLYLRDEYPAARHILETEIAALAAAGLTADHTIHLRRGAGAYICGEESAMLESLEGKRGLPRHKPPFPAEVGLFGRPTLIHNVETLHWVREIVEDGAARFANLGVNGGKGMRLWSVSGRVARPGVVAAPVGITARQLIDDYCGGMAEGHVFFAYLPGGASGGILTADQADLPLDFGSLDELGCFVGSAAIVILSDSDSIRDAVLNLTRFFEGESCGQCTPCRLGTEKAAKLLARPVWDEALLGDIATVMSDASICGLGHAAANPMLSAFSRFRAEIGS